MDKVPWDTDYLPWRAFIAAYHCPSDGNCTPSPAGSGTPNPANYRGCLGDMEFPWSCAGTGAYPANVMSYMRGIFDDYGREMSAVSDGLSNTLLFGETLVDREGGLATKMVPDHTPSSCIANLDTSDRTQFLSTVNPANGWFGRRWSDCVPSQSAFNANLTPNSPACTWSSDTNSCFVAA